MRIQHFKIMLSIERKLLVTNKNFNSLLGLEFLRNFLYFKLALQDAVYNVNQFEKWIKRPYSYFEKRCRKKAKNCTSQSRKVFWDTVNEF